jgi:hypothetical protein
MNRNFLSKVPVALVALATSASVFAASDTDSRINMLEQQMKQVRTETAVGTYGARTASARPSNEGSDYYVTFDVLSWKAGAGGLEYAYTDTSGGGFPVEGNIKTNSFQWDWGLRVGIGYKFDYDDWEADAAYTYFKAHADERINQTATFDVIPLKSDPLNSPAGDFLSASKSSSQVKIRLDNIDVHLARHYFVSKDLSFRPHFGLKNSWIQLNQDLRFEGNRIPASKIVENFETSKFWGIGPEMGVDSKWYLCNGFSIFGAASGSLLYGYFKVYHEEEHSADEDNYVSISAPLHRFVPNAQISLGLAYDRYFNDDKQHFGATLGWETIYYFRANQFIQLTDASSRRYAHVSEDVSFQGVTLHLRLDF